jgi:hypothetical protein
MFSVHGHKLQLEAPRILGIVASSSVSRADSAFAAATALVLSEGEAVVPGFHSVISLHVMQQNLLASRGASWFEAGGTERIYMVFLRRANLYYHVIRYQPTAIPCSPRIITAAASLITFLDL